MWRKRILWSTDRLDKWRRTSLKKMQSTATRARLIWTSNAVVNHTANLVSNRRPSSPNTGSTTSCEAEEVAAPSATIREEGELEVDVEQAVENGFLLLRLPVSQDIALSARGNLGLDRSPPSWFLSVGAT